MPRISARKRALRDLDRIVSRTKAAEPRFLLDDEDAFEDDIDELYELQREQIRRNRYLMPRSKYRKRSARWEAYLNDNECMNGEEFVQHFRVSRSAFQRIVAFVRDDHVFQAEAHRTFRGHAELHLMVLLNVLGTFGKENTALKLAMCFGLGKGSISNYICRAVSAVLKLESKTLTWPDSDERKLIAHRIQAKYAFVNCVGVTDGTLLPLEFKPTANGEDYFSRKGSYCVNALITCDDVARVRNVVVGWPGSVHDNRVWSNSKLCQAKDAHFDPNQYFLGDSAFQPSQIMVPAFKKPPKRDMCEQNSYFNTKLAKARIKSEHSIGLLKARFQYLKGIRVKICNKSDMKKVLQYFICASILHNLLIDEPIPSGWDDEIARNGLSEDDELNVATSANSGSDERRNQLLCYMLEIRN